MTQITFLILLINSKNCRKFLCQYSQLEATEQTPLFINTIRPRESQTGHRKGKRIRKTKSGIKKLRLRFELSSYTGTM